MMVSLQLWMVCAHKYVGGFAHNCVTYKFGCFGKYASGAYCSMCTYLIAGSWYRAMLNLTSCPPATLAGPVQISCKCRSRSDLHLHACMNVWSACIIIQPPGLVKMEHVYEH